MRIVLDTNILVRANVRAQGPARELLTRIIHGDHVLITSPFLLRETARSLALSSAPKALGAQLARHPGTRRFAGEDFVRR